MKKTILYTLLALLSLTSCTSDEDPIEPTGNYSVLRFDFPQGNNDYDMEIKKIYDDFGIFIIYKDITSPDLNRRWTSLGTDKLKDYVPIKEADIPFYVSFLRNHVFNYLTGDLAKRAFPVKMYICEQFGDYDQIPSDLSGTGIGTGLPSTEGGGTGTGGGTGAGGVKQILTLANSASLFDYWAVSFTREGIDKKDKDELRLARIRFIYLTIKEAYNEGTIVDCPEALSLLDFETPYLNKEDEQKEGALDNPNHRLNRGYPYYLADDFREYTNYMVGVSYMRNDPNYGYFLNYIRTALFYSREELMKKYEKHPLIIEVYDAIVKYMKETYGIDIAGINEGPES